MKIQVDVIETGDGSHTLYVPALDERYHSWHGAIQESKHVFIEMGLKPQVNQNKSSINILEIGLGTGLNALLTLIEARENATSIHYAALEANPLHLDVVSKLNYIDLLEASSFKSLFDEIHICLWNTTVKLDNSFSLNKMHATLQEVIFTDTFDLVYFDAFGPRVQPEMWTDEMFQKIYNSLNSGAMLVTYCAKGEVKRTLKRVGFQVETLQGPPGKREMVRGIKP